nr:hypothetical protein [Halomonas sp. HL-48]
MSSAVAASIGGIIGPLITERPKGDIASRLAFVLGLVSGPVLALFNGGLGNVSGALGEVIGQPSGVVLLMLVAGLLVGLGTGLGSGCTSGHGVCGLARLSISSLVTTFTFLIAAIITVFVVRHVMGGNV